MIGKTCGLECVAVCCSKLHCVAVCCSELQYVAVCCSMLQCVEVSLLLTPRTLSVKYFQDSDWNRLRWDSSVLRCVAVWCSVLQCVAVCCSVLQCVAVCCSGL